MHRESPGKPARSKYSHFFISDIPFPRLRANYEVLPVQVVTFFII
jgi:hypothetical protein